MKALLRRFIEWLSAHLGRALSAGQVARWEGEEEVGNANENATAAELRDTWKF